MLAAIDEITAPLPEYFLAQGAQALEGFDVNLPSILASVDKGVAQTHSQITERSTNAYAQLNDMAVKTESEITAFAGKAIQQAQALGPQLQAQIDRALASAIVAVTTAPEEVIARITPPVEEATNFSGPPKTLIRGGRPTDRGAGRLRQRIGGVHQRNAR